MYRWTQQPPTLTSFTFTRRPGSHHVSRGSTMRPHVSQALLRTIATHDHNKNFSYPLHFAASSSPHLSSLLFFASFTHPRISLPSRAVTPSRKGWSGGDSCLSITDFINIRKQKTIVILRPLLLCGLIRRRGEVE
ncbi:hypothetical protein E2C01_002653 [Portunus trituberculatus]|uniref:Uncharacterized protein n=1 Tax=Portunus trituberculatus TaxID=210409 RepID=A0A5B7CKH6_PORTR|nr:hypothetical protein [Portunus trituberculatus]